MFLEFPQIPIVSYILLAQIVLVFLSYLIFARKLFNPLSPRFYYIFLKRTMGLSIFVTMLFVSIHARSVLLGIGFFLVGSFFILIVYLIIRFVVHEMHTDIKEEYEKYVRENRIMFGLKEE